MNTNMPIWLVRACSSQVSPVLFSLLPGTAGGRPEARDEGHTPSVRNRLQTDQAFLANRICEPKHPIPPIVMPHDSSEALLRVCPRRTPWDHGPARSFFSSDTPEPGFVTSGIKATFSRQTSCHRQDVQKCELKFWGGFQIGSTDKDGHCSEGGQMPPRFCVSAALPCDHTGEGPGHGSSRNTLVILLQP